MLAHCNQCNQTQDIKLSRENDKPICLGCGKEVTNLSIFTLNSMRDRKDYTEKVKKGFSFKCNKCNEQRPGILSKDQKSVVCSECNEPMQVTEYMLNTLRMLQRTTIESSL